MSCVTVINNMPKLFRSRIYHIKIRFHVNNTRYIQVPLKTGSPKVIFI